MSGTDVSQLEFSFLCDCEDFLRSIFQPAGSGNRFDGSVSLHLNFRVLFPATNISRHVVEHDFFLEELVHLALDRILIAGLDERGRIVDARHRVEVLVLARVHSANSEIIVEEVLAMTTIGHTIVNQ